MKAYLAGPDVFRQDAKVVLELKKEICEALGVKGLSPLDNDPGPQGPTMANLIYRGNINLIKECDVVIADISPFRGPGVDAGTAFEIGFGAALGKEIYLYSSATGTEYRERAADGDGLAAEPWPNVEDFGLADNLMIICARTNGKLSPYLTFREAVQAWVIGKLKEAKVS